MSPVPPARTGYVSSRPPIVSPSSRGPIHKAPTQVLKDRGVRGENLLDALGSLLGREFIEPCRHARAAPSPSLMCASRWRARAPVEHPPGRAKS